jgi:hypothetical protein
MCSWRRTGKCRKLARLYATNDQCAPVAARPEQAGEPVACPVTASGQLSGVIALPVWEFDQHGRGAGIYESSGDIPVR